MGLAPSFGYYGKHFCIFTGVDFFLLTSLEDVVAMPFNDLISMGWKLSFHTVVVVRVGEFGQSLMMVLEWSSNTVYNSLSKDFWRYLQWAMLSSTLVLV